MTRILLLAIFVYFIASSSGIQVNQTELFGPAKFRSDLGHSLATFWPLHSLTGLIGSLLNIFVLYIFISDRQTLTTSINCMIWYIEFPQCWSLLLSSRMDTLFRLLYSSVAVHWRSYLMYFRRTLLQDLLSFETVRKSIRNFLLTFLPPGVSSHDLPHQPGSHR